MTSKKYIEKKATAGASNFSARWKELDRFPGYSVSSDGYVANSNGMEITAHAVAASGRRQYRYVTLYSAEKGKRSNYVVARLVLEAFVGPAPSRRHVVCRANGISTDDRLENLKWALMSEVQAHTISTVYGQKANTVFRRGKTTIPEKTIRAICKDLLADKLSYSKIAEKRKVSKSTVTQIANGKRWRDVAIDEGLFSDSRA